MNEIEQVTKVAQGISDFGILVMIAAFFLIFSAGVMIWNMRSYKTLIERVMTEFSEKLEKVSSTASDNSQIMSEIARRAGTRNPPSHQVHLECLLRPLRRTGVPAHQACTRRKSHH